jgi:hypothetical protein
VHEKEVKIEASRAISESVSDYIEFGMGKSHHPQSQLKEKEASSQNDNLEQALSEKIPEGLNAVESKISPKES